MYKTYLQLIKDAVPQISLPLYNYCDHKVPSKD